MFKIIFDLAIEPLGLPIEWYQEWIILGIIGLIAYFIAYDKVRDLYHSHMISGRMSGSFLHWIIRAVCFIVLWAITYGVIWIGKFAIENKVLIGVIAVTVFLIIVTIKVLLMSRRKIVINVEAQSKKIDKGV